MHNVIFIFFFLSGFSSLVFEVLWERSLMQVFGTTSLALSTLLTAFMAGLALGSYLGGRVAPRLRRPLVVYALLEGAIGLYAFTIPWTLGLLPSIYRVFFDHFLDDFYLFSLLRFAAVFLILVVPTTMMGATLPIVSQWLARRASLFQGRIGWLYAVNTFGACSGCLLAGFVILPHFGLSLTNTIFALVNIALCVLVLVASPRLFGNEVERPDEDPELAAAVGAAQLAEPLSALARRLVVIGFGLAGIVAMSYQVLWTRAYVIVLGSSTYSFTLILTTFLLGLSAGGALISLFVDRIRRPVLWLAATQFGLAGLAVLTFWFLDELPEWMFYRMREEIGAPQEIYLYQFFLVGLLVFVPIALQGMAFPLVVRAVVRARERSGRDVGRAYAVNTVGSIIGSFVAGFVLLPWVGLHRAIAGVVALNLGLAAVFAVVELVSTTRKRRAASLVAPVAIAAALAFALAPSIDRVRLTRGMFRVYWARELFDPQKLARDNPELVFYEDGLTATTSVERRGGLVTLKANGKPEASDGADMATQILVALLPFLVRSTRDVALGEEEVGMVGFGSGVTAGAALQWPLERLDVVEIEATMVEASRFFDHVNHRPLEDPRTVLIESDGRNFLEYTDRRYDVIVSEPSNPWIAGVASLFTVEHFRRAKRHLEPHGVFAQWVQLYEISPENVRRIFATFCEVFPHVHAFSSMPKGTDLILVGSEEPITFPPDGFERAWEIDSVRRELERAGIRRPHDVLGLMFMSDEEMRAFAEGAELNTDDNGLLEFAAPKDLIRYDVGEEFFSRKYFHNETYGDPRGYLDGWPGSWSRESVGQLAMGMWAAGKRQLAEDVLASAGFEREEVLSSLASRRAQWPEQIDCREPSQCPFDAVEQVMLAAHAADLDLDEAMVRAWPGQDAGYRRLVQETVAQSQHLQAMMYLERDGEPPRGGFEGEKGLLYAYLLARRQYFRHAFEQVEGLSQREDPVTETLPYRLVAGWVYAKRRRYEQSFRAYLAAGASLL